MRHVLFWLINSRPTSRTWQAKKYAWSSKTLNSELSLPSAVCRAHNIIISQFTSHNRAARQCMSCSLNAPHSTWLLKTGITRTLYLFISQINSRFRLQTTALNYLNIVQLSVYSNLNRPCRYWSCTHLANRCETATLLQPIQPRNQTHRTKALGRELGGTPLCVIAPTESQFPVVWS